MLERGYYKHYKGSVYYVICTAIQCNDNNTQQKFVIYKPIDSDIIYCRPIENFDAFVEVDGERLRRFKKVNEDYPTWPPTVTYSPYSTTTDIYQFPPIKVTYSNPMYSD